MIVRRNFNFPLFDLFDAPINAVSCSGRDVSTVAPQALWLLNNNLALHQSTHFANRLAGEMGTDTNAQIKRAFELSSRTTTDRRRGRREFSVYRTAESEPIPKRQRFTAAEILRKLSPEDASALVKFCLTLFNLNEFIYVD